MANEFVGPTPYYSNATMRDKLLREREKALGGLSDQTDTSNYGRQGVNPSYQDEAAPILQAAKDQLATSSEVSPEEFGALERLSGFAERKLTPKAHQFGPAVTGLVSFASDPLKIHQKEVPGISDASVSQFAPPPPFMLGANAISQYNRLRPALGPYASRMLTGAGKYNPGQTPAMTDNLSRYIMEGLRRSLAKAEGFVGE